MQTSTKKTACNICGDGGVGGRTIKDRIFSLAQGCYVWDCRCCHTQVPVRVRRSQVQIRMDENNGEAPTLDQLLAELRAKD